MIQPARLILLVLFPFFPAVAQVPVWKQNKGVIVIEAERALHYSPSSAWVHENVLPGFHGEGYVVWRGQPDWGPEERPYDSISDPSRILAYRINIVTPGTYKVKVLNRHLKKDGDNDVWVSVNAGPWGKTYDWQVDEWSVDERGKWALYQLQKGIYTIEIAGRSSGFCIDRILIYRNDPRDEELVLRAVNESPSGRAKK